MAISIKFYPEKRKDATGKIKEQNVPILVSVTYNGQRIKTTTGLNAENLNQWSDKNQKFRPSASNATKKNKSLQDLKIRIEGVYYDAINNNIPVPSAQYLKSHIKQKKELQRKNFFEVFDKFVKDQAVKNSWSTRTKDKFRVVRTKLLDFEQSEGGYRIEFDSIDEAFFSKFLEFLIQQEYSNVYIKKNLKLLRQFLNWCDAHGYKIQYDFHQFRFRGKEPAPGTNIRPLTLGQLMHMYEIQISNDRLCKVRDCFVFQCFTGLRYGDLRNLKKPDVSDDGMTIKISTLKTGTPVVVPLVSYAREILKKYKNLYGDRALPVISGQKYNDYLKEVGKLAGLNNEITEVNFIGGKRVEKRAKHWERLTSHTARQTFVSNAVLLNMPTEIIRAMTGHSNDKIMRSYLKILNQQKVAEMSKFENFGKDK